MKKSAAGNFKAHDGAAERKFSAGNVQIRLRIGKAPFRTLFGALSAVNIDFGSEPIEPYVFKDAAELAKAIGAGGYDLDLLRSFRDRYIDIDTDSCTAALADFIVSACE